MFDELKTKEFKELQKKYFEIYGRYPAFNYDDYSSIEEYIDIVKRKVESKGITEDSSTKKGIRNQSWENYLADKMAE